MFARQIESAFETGAELMVYLRGQADPFSGSVRDWDGEYFTLFHNGCCHGMLWTLRLEDVQTCGLMIPVPDAGEIFCSAEEVQKES